MQELAAGKSDGDALSKTATLSQQRRDRKAPTMRPSDVLV
jgi:hypothetical protein